MSNIIIKLKGGTGNQLFQAAAAFSLANIYGKTWKYTTANISKNKYRRKLENLSMELILDLYVKGPKNKFKYNYKLFKNIHKNSPNVPVLFSKNNSIFLLLHIQTYNF